MPELWAQTVGHFESRLKEKLIDVASSARSLKQSGHDSSSTTAELIETFRPACANSKVCARRSWCGQAPWLVRSCRGAERVQALVKVVGTPVGV